MKKIITALTLTLSNLSFAGTMGPICTPGNSTVPCSINQWDIGIEALYLKPIDDANDAYFPTTTNQYKAIDNKWGWGYRLTGSYIFNTGNDINLDWSHYDNTTHSVGVTPDELLPFNLSNANRFDRTNLVFGQHIDFSLVKNTRFYGGLQYANIHVNRLRTNYQITPDIFTINDNADFNGVGPIMGVDFAYAIRSGFNITANTNTSILYGTSRSNINTSIPGGLVTSASYASSKANVLSIEEKLGLNYQHQFTQGLLTVDGGYQALNYFNALVRTPTTGIINSDFGLFGPYFGVHWTGLA